MATCLLKLPSSRNWKVPQTIPLFLSTSPIHSIVAFGKLKLIFFFLRVRRCRWDLKAAMAAQSRSTGLWDGARGFLADPTPQTACSVIGTAPGVSMQTHPKLPSGPQANLVAHLHAPLSASCAWPSSWPSAAPPALLRARGLRRGGSPPPPAVPFPAR